LQPPVEIFRLIELETFPAAFDKTTCSDLKALTRRSQQSFLNGNRPLPPINIHFKKWLNSHSQADNREEIIEGGRVSESVIGQSSLEKTMQILQVYQQAFFIDVFAELNGFTRNKFS
jgi:hypothetical protein